MSESDGSDRLLLARISAVCFVLGLFVPIVIAFVGNDLMRAPNGGGAAAAIFFFVSESLALILGAVGWRHASGKTGLVGGVAAICLFVLLVIVRCRATPPPPPPSALPDTGIHIDAGGPEKAPAKAGKE